MRQAKTWTTIDTLSIIWKSGNKNSGSLLSSGWINTTLWMPYIDADKTYREKAKWEVLNTATGYIEQTLASTTSLPPLKPFE